MSDRMTAAQLRKLTAETGGNFRSEAALMALDAMGDKPTPVTPQARPRRKGLPLFVGHSETRAEALRQVIAVLERHGERNYKDESDLVWAMKAAVEDPALGYEMALIGQRDARKSGTTKGFPDTAVWHPEWQIPAWIAIEVKYEDGECSQAQRLLNERGGSVVCRSVTEILRALLAIEEGQVSE